MSFDIDDPGDFDNDHDHVDPPDHDSLDPFQTVSPDGQQPILDGPPIDQPDADQAAEVVGTPESLWPDDGLDEWLGSPADVDVPEIPESEVRPNSVLDDTIAGVLGDLPADLEDPKLLEDMISKVIEERSTDE